MRLTLLVLAIDAEKELVRVLPELRHIGDELVIGVDNTTTDATARVARQFTDQVHPVSHAGFCGRGRPEDLNAVESMLPHCHGDWVLRIDQDETLSELWRDPHYLSGLLEDRHATHYWIPRRWVVPPGDRYISNRHWYPDYQLRLFRNIPSLVNFNRLPHAPPCMAGEARRLTGSWIVHWDYIRHDRAQRESKVEFYRQVSTYTASEFYIYEGQRYETRPLAQVIPETPAGAPRQGLEGGRQGAPYCAALEILDCPAAMEAGKREPVLIAIRNCSDRLLCPSSVLVRPGNAYLSYHWFSADRAIYRWDNQRTELPRRLEPGESAASYMTVAAPEKPGDYFFQPDLVEEGVAWFSAHSAIPSHPVRVE